MGWSDKIMDIEKIFGLLNCNNSIEKQKRGIREASNSCTHVLGLFLKQYNNKDVWYNCALIISQQTDEKLEPYLVELFDWIKNMDDPGADLIMERLGKYNRNSIFLLALSLRLNKAKKLNNKEWEENLNKLISL